MVERTRFHVSPYARKTARELGVMLEPLTGTGPNGRIVWRDVEAASKTEEKPSCGVVAGYYTTADISELLAALKTLDGALTFPVFTERAAARLNVPVRFAGNGMEDMTGGTFTISSLGPYGITNFSPIINQPELAILGVCDMVDTPVVRSGEIVIRPMMNLCLTADHRVVDGVMASKFLKRICELLENPYMLLV